MIVQFVFLAIFTLVSRANFMLNNATRFAGRKRAPSQRWAGASASEIVCQRASEQERERESVAASTSDCSERLTRTGSPKRNDSPFRNWKRTDQNSRECKQGVRGEQREGERERERTPASEGWNCACQRFAWRAYQNIQVSGRIQGASALLWLLFGVLHYLT